MTSRIGVYGGMFDPVHNGHVEAANFAVSLLDLDELRLVPCLQPNHRDPATAGPEQRLHMLELATRGMPKLRIDTRELTRGGVSYTVDTLQSLYDEQVAQHLVLIMGLDSFNSLPHWHRWQQLFDYAHLLVLNRRGGKLQDAVLRATAYAERSVENPGDLFACDSGCIYFAEQFNNDLSSTQVRNSLRANQGDVLQMLGKEVNGYILDKQLYRRQESA